MHRYHIVVMGGSFNPPTIAHFRIMATALDAVHAAQGFLVPVSFPYLKRKMIKAGQSHLSLPDDLRLRMLEAMSAADSRISIFQEAMDKPFSDDVAVLDCLQARFPDACIHCVLGDDKLPLLELFSRKKGFFDRYRCILFCRDSASLLDSLRQSEQLAAHLSACTLIDAIDGMEHVSSTRIRAQLFNIDAVADMLHPAVLPLLRTLKKEDFPEEILKFRGAYAFLSNDFPAQMDFGALTYPCAASAFLATMCDTPEDRRRISQISAEKAWQQYAGRLAAPGREAQQLAVMEDVLREKFRQHPDLREKLLATGNRRLINGGNSLLWGVHLTTWKGQNQLGQLLMKLRDEWKEDSL